MKQPFAALITAYIFLSIGPATAATTLASAESLPSISSSLICSENSDKAKDPKKKKKKEANDEEPECE